MKIRILHPIAHGGIEYGRGIYDTNAKDSILNESTAQFLIDIKDGTTGKLLRHAVPFDEETIIGKATKTIDAQDALKKASEEEETNNKKLAREKSSGK